MVKLAERVESKTIPATEAAFIRGNNPKKSWVNHNIEIVAPTLDETFQNIN